MTASCAVRPMSSLEALQIVRIRGLAKLGLGRATPAGGPKASGNTLNRRNGFEAVSRVTECRRKRTQNHFDARYDLYLAILALCCRMISSCAAFALSNSANARSASA